MSRDALAYVDSAAIQHNLAQVKIIAPHASVLAMVKGNGYGHGIVRVAKALSSADALGVACIDEAMILRQAGIHQIIIAMSGFLNEEELRYCSNNNITCVIHTAEQIEYLIKNPLKKPLPIWIKIDTGMHRLGFLPNQFEENYQRLMNCSSVEIMGVMTHLADADNNNSQYTEHQIHLFQKITQHLSCKKSIANSAALLHYKESIVDWVRPGIMLYGVSPFTESEGHELHLKSAMTLTAKVIEVKTLKKGDKVGYGITWESPEPMKIGVVAIGYADGYPRHAITGTPTLIHNTICPLVGRVSMDMITVDLRSAPQTRVGDGVTLWGGALPIERIARCATTIPYELLCNVTARVKFIEI